jgi:hypothetical protein
MAKLFYLKEFIDREKSADAIPSRPFAVRRSPTSASRKINPASRIYDDAAIWKMAVQLEMAKLSDAGAACKLQND